MASSRVPDVFFAPKCHLRVLEACAGTQAGSQPWVMGRRGPDRGPDQDPGRGPDVEKFETFRFFQHVLKRIQISVFSPSQGGKGVKFSPLGGGGGPPPLTEHLGIS